jgi:proline iminopeptidase
MAADAIGLLDALGIAAAHMVGFSMGGMIAQILAALHADRTLSMTGLMTSSGQAWLESSAEADRMMRQSIVAAPDAQSLASMQLEAEEIYAGPSELPGRRERRKAIECAIARGHHSAGIWRQAIAMRAADDRRDLLRSIAAPVLMIHGQQDPVIALSQAAAIKETLPAASFIELSRTGHVLTEDNSPRIAAIISAFWNDHPAR